jgi:hypothetical protein
LTAWLPHAVFVEGLASCLPYVAHDEIVQLRQPRRRVDGRTIASLWRDTKTIFARTLSAIREIWRGTSLSHPGGPGWLRVKAMCSDPR